MEQTANALARSLVLPCLVTLDGDDDVKKAYFGEEEIAWANSSEKTVGLIVSILLIQIVAIFGAILTARASERFGNVRVLIVINFIWVGLCIIAYYTRTPVQFYTVAGMVGMVMGGLQSLSRSTYSKLLPETLDTTSFFSFYDVTEKIGIVIGMVCFGLVDHITLYSKCIKA